ncbi:uncharacterized protein A1O9_11499 [Exophiala aquamarina CBS 119918]|uniref:NAD(P)-binding domain-containing protein n=1 Tax=Exophiala aquamarina CBS 119918 TaxID=1182545 RepID=A0A072NWP2_9EURO|nr:uncharacterized protein A1O9_11499 [Exophiala aquamarina CBS 119918]KEF52259.1 hypothetical protein A1O9_11499 [Exophiala aquamarina CBS 119918]
MEPCRVAIAGFTSRVAQLITSHLLEQPDIEITGICRDTAKVPSHISQNPSVTLVKAEYSDVTKLRTALRNASVCVCCYFGPEELMLGGQLILIDACIAENVPRYLASDFSFDFRGLKIGDFPFKDFQLKVDEYLAKKESEGRIKSVHILSGGFFEAVFCPFMGTLEVESRKVRYWGTGEEPWDMTSMEDTAKFTARVVGDQGATGVFNVRGERHSPKQIADALEICYGTKFSLENLGTLQELQEKMISARNASPGDPGAWLGLHYNYYTINGSTLLRSSENDKYPDLKIDDLKSFFHRHKLEQLPTLFR